MTEILGQWIRGIAGAALIGAAAMTLTPKGRVKSVLWVVCGVVLLIAVLSPLLKTLGLGAAIDISEYRAEADRIAGEAGENAGELNRTIIEDRFEAYIRDKAAALGMAGLEVRLTARWNSAGGYWFPYEAEMSGEATAQQRALLGAYMESELGIMQENQCWEAEAIE